MPTSSQIKKMLKLKKVKSSILGVSTGSTQLNLSCTENPKIGFVVGHYYGLVGDSAAGKTWIAHTTLAEASINPKFDDYRLIYDDVEHGALFDIERYFGSRLVSRLEPPAGTRESPIYSETVEQAYDNVDSAIEEGSSFLYVIDSMDALETEDDIKKISKLKLARSKGKADKESGSFGTSKAKINSMRLRKLMGGLRKTNSILIILGQTRDNLGFGFQPKTRAGGHALKFYATLEIWMSIKEKVKRTVNGKPRSIGIIAKAQIKKNRVKGKDRIAYIPIYYSSGIDDIGANISWLISENHWKGNKTGTKVIAPEFDFSGTLEELVRQIEEQQQEKELQKLVTSVWKEIESKCSVDRKSRYE